MKKIITLIVAIFMMISITAYASPKYGEELENMPAKSYSQKFDDVKKSHWAFSYIAEMTEKGILTGYPDGKFRPNNNITRAEFAKVMITASGLKVAPVNYTSFIDVTIEDWFAPYIEAAKPFLNGYIIAGKNTYLPDSLALREDIAVALVKLKGYDTSVADVSLLYAMFSDASSISASAQKYVAVAVERGLVSGYDDGTFRGQQSVTRAEAAALLWRASQYGNDNKIISGESEDVRYDPVVKPDNKEEDISDFEVEESDEPEVSKPYKIETLVGKIKNFETMTYDANNDILYYIEDGVIKGSNGYELSLSDERFYVCDKKKEDKRHICKFELPGLALDPNSDRLYLAIREDESYLFDITDEEPKLVFQFSEEYHYTTKNFEILENGCILISAELYDEDGQHILPLDGHAIYHKNKFYWFDFDLCEKTILCSEDCTMP